MSYDAPKVEAGHEYTVEIDGWRVLSFQFQWLQLNRMKFECLRLLWTMRLDAARAELIRGCINSYLVSEQ